MQVAGTWARMSAMGRGRGVFCLCSRCVPCSSESEKGDLRKTWALKTNVDETVESGPGDREFVVAGMVGLLLVLGFKNVFEMVGGRE